MLIGLPRLSIGRPCVLSLVDWIVTLLKIPDIVF